ncbi:MAG: AtpZ/AtpI family protein [Erysipelotrichaceae bacterium]
MNFQEIKPLTFISQFGIIMIVNIGIGVFIGVMLDRWLGVSPWLLIIFMISGIVNAFRSIYALAMGEVNAKTTSKNSDN